MSVQSVVIKKSKMTRDQAITWIKKHAYTMHYGIDETDNYYRFRQFPPDPKYNYSTKPLDGLGYLIVVH